MLNLLEIEEESNLPLEGAARARLGKEKPQKVLDPINCLPVHLHLDFLEEPAVCNWYKCLWHHKLIETVKVETLESEKQEHKLP